MNRPARLLVPLLCCILVYSVVVVNTSDMMANRSPVIKLGYAPDGKYLKYIVGDQRSSLASIYTLKSMIYYGDIIRQWYMGLRPAAELFNMFGFLQSSVLLDPYNMDTYYFSQAAFTWEVGHAADVNALLDYGMKYRDWDWMLPYFAGFNKGYFLKNNSEAARYMKKAAELSGNSLFTTLSARYMYESGDTKQAILFLDAMIHDANPRDKAVLESLKTRKTALEAIDTLETAVRNYRDSFEKKPNTLLDLIISGDLESIPKDPYGGYFYLDETGRVQTTSKLAFSAETKKND